MVGSFHCQWCALSLSSLVSQSIEMHIHFSDPSFVQRNKMRDRYWKLEYMCSISLLICIFVNKCSYIRGEKTCILLFHCLTYKNSCMFLVPLDLLSLTTPSTNSDFKPRKNALECFLL